MRTTYHIYRPAATKRETHHANLPQDPGYVALKTLIEPLLNGRFMEHVTVLYEARRADMFVDEDGHAAGLPRNDAATAIYRANWLKKHPETDPESLPFVVGTAILFERLVWF